MRMLANVLLLSNQADNGRALMRKNNNEDLRAYEA